MFAKVEFISPEDLEQLREDAKFLEALRRAGVDNWDGYDYALDIYAEMEDENIGD